MNYLLSDKNTLIWLFFTIYVMSAIFIIPNNIFGQNKSLANDVIDDQALQFASRFVLRLVLIFPMLILLGNSF